MAQGPNSFDGVVVGETEVELFVSKRAGGEGRNDITMFAVIAGDAGGLLIKRIPGEDPDDPDDWFPVPAGRSVTFSCNQVKNNNLHIKKIIAKRRDGVDTTASGGPVEFGIQSD